MNTSACLLRCCLGCFIAAVASQSSGAGDWPQWLGPDRNGVSSESVGVWTDPPPVVWRRPMGNGFSVPVVAEDTVFVHAAVTDKDEEEVVALDARTGDVLWRDAYPRAAYRSELGVGPRATPSVVDGRLYTIGITGVLSCYDCASGERLWQANPYDELKLTLPGFGVCSSPVVVEGHVVLPIGGAGAGIMAYNAGTGEIAWKLFDEPAGSASPVIFTTGSGDDARTDVVVQTTLRLAGVDPATGVIRWEHPLVFQPSGVSPTPLVLGDQLICTTQDTGTLALRLPQAADGKPELMWWHDDVPSYFSTGTVDPQGRALVVTNALVPLPRADLRCFDVATGDELWISEGLGYFHLGVLMLADGKVLILDDAGNLTFAQPHADRLEELVETKVCNGTFVAPVLADSRLYVRDNLEIVCLQLPPAESAGP